MPLAPRVREPVIFKAGWLLSLYPAAAEAGGTLVYSYRKSFPGRRGAAQDGERSRVEAARRARGKLRRYCAANGLNRLGTLTYGPPFCTDPHQVRADVAVFFRGLRAGLGGNALPYVWVPELHADGDRFHVHFAVGRFVARGVIESVWGHGFVHIKLLGDLPVGSGRLGEARAAAGYLAKYVGKALADESHGRRPFGGHRYEVGQGFTPIVERITGRTATEVLDAASERMGGSPTRQWNSVTQENWKGSPAVWAQWNR